MPLERNQRYSELFTTEQEKAEAFDKIAEAYYNRNFGSISKADFDVLMFSIYIERLLELSEESMEAYSDYELSKQLGITQSKIKSLKVKKELLYPYTLFDWRKSFARVCKNATFEQEKIHININDPNLFIELKHFVELKNGRVDIQLNPNSFITSVDMFIELLIYIGKAEDIKAILDSIRQIYHKNAIETKKIEKENIGKIIRENASKITGKIILKGLKECVERLTAPVGTIVRSICNVLTDD